MRDVLRASLARSLAGLSELDRLSAAWPIVAGHALVARASVISYLGGTVTLAAQDEQWHRQLLLAAERLRPELARVSGVPVTDILLVIA